MINDYENEVVIEKQITYIKMDANILNIKYKMYNNGYVY